MNTRPRRVTVLGTGGTIAMVKDPGMEGARLAASTAQPPAPMLAADIIVEREDFCAVPSASMSLSLIGGLAERIAHLVSNGMDAVVVTHGTDTLEETAFALSLLLPSDCPTVLTGALRTGDSPGADGPANLADAITVAASGKLAGLGPLVVMNGEIHLAALVAKRHTSAPSAFSSVPFGPIGCVTEGRADIVLGARTAFDTHRLGPKRPIVAILEIGMDLEPDVIAAFEQASVDGLIVAGAGGGHVSARSVASLARLTERIPVILASRIGSGGTLARTYGYEGGEMDLLSRGLISAGRLRPVQARILLQILLSQGADRTAIAAAFAPVGRS